MFWTTHLPQSLITPSFCIVRIRPKDRFLPVRECLYEYAEESCDGGYAGDKG